MGISLAVLAGLVIYAYGFQVTKVNLGETREERRQTQLIRIIRALARPDILQYDRQEFIVDQPIWVPCPETDFAEVSAGEPNEPYMVVTPACAEPLSEIKVEGFNFEPDTAGPLNFIPPSGVSLQMGTIQTDSDGHFLVNARLPKRPNEASQHIRAVTRRNVGGPHFSQNARDTWGKIIETIFMAFLATTLGVAIAIPASFLAARNIMTPITSPFTSVALTILVLPIGLLLGWWAATQMGDLSHILETSISLIIIGLIAGPMVVWLTFRWALPAEEERAPSPGVRFMRLFVLLISVLLGICSLFVFSSVTVSLGLRLVKPLGSFGFLGNFLSTLGDILGLSLVLISALAGAAVTGSLAGRSGQWIVEHTTPPVYRSLNLILGAAAGATLSALIGAGISWLYQMNNITTTIVLPAVLGGLSGLATAAFLSRNSTLPIGFTIYMLTRTIFNALRSIEALVMAIVFVVWVGIGPFAGVLALALHTIASNAKLYSEQVEAILPGPLEAVTATGANRLQTIVYAVIPQIIPPYISYTMYRWDINVRMSTIIGFAGGGGIGFLLQQNMNLLNYRAASAQMLAIAIVVASMDYLSSKLREKAI